jgi:co-chaperonin GroES (HSP10)
MEVFYANILVELMDNDLSNGVYKSNEDSLQTRKCKITGIGPGYLNEEHDYTPLPWKVDDVVFVMNHAWVQAEHEDKTYLIVKAENVMTRVS